MEANMEIDDGEYQPTAVFATQEVPVVQQDPQPNHTIYIKNMNYKMESNKLRIALYNEFVKFGKILDVVVGEHRYALKGQAWIVFDQVEDAIKAQEQMNNKVILNRPATICFAKTESDIILKREGRFVYSKREFESYANKLADSEEDPVRAAAARIHNNPPNHTLLLYDLPATITSDPLLPIFQPYVGFHELRIVPGGRGLAFVEFDTIRNAGNCLSAVKSMNLPTGERLFASYAK